VHGALPTDLKHLNRHLGFVERKSTASGHTTTDTDPGIAAAKGDHSLEIYSLSTDHYQIELLANLDKAP